MCVLDPADRYPVFRSGHRIQSQGAIVRQHRVASKGHRTGNDVNQTVSYNIDKAAAAMSMVNSSNRILLCTHRLMCIVLPFDSPKQCSRVYRAK